MRLCGENGVYGRALSKQQTGLLLSEVTTPGVLLLGVLRGVLLAIGSRRRAEHHGKHRYVTLKPAVHAFNTRAKGSPGTRRYTILSGTVIARLAGNQLDTGRARLGIHDQ